MPKTRPAAHQVLSPHLHQRARDAPAAQSRSPHHSGALIIRASVEMFDYNDIDISLEWTRQPGAGIRAEAVIDATWKARERDEWPQSPRRYVLYRTPTVVESTSGTRIAFSRLSDDERDAARAVAVAVIAAWAWEQWWWNEVAYEHLSEFGPVSFAWSGGQDSGALAL